MLLSCDIRRCRKALSFDKACAGTKASEAATTQSMRNLKCHEHPISQTAIFGVNEDQPSAINSEHVLPHCVHS